MDELHAKAMMIASPTDPQTYAIIGAAMEVHRELWHGFLEGVYQHALARELATRDVPFQREAEVPVMYKGAALPCGYRADFLCYGEIIVELKALPKIGNIEQAQVINYLKATGLKRALILNFGTQSLERKRIVV
jgi:GxxExxY protein